MTVLRRTSRQSTYEIRRYSNTRHMTGFEQSTNMNHLAVVRMRPTPHKKMEEKWMRSADDHDGGDPLNILRYLHYQNLISLVCIVRQTTYIQQHDCSRSRGWWSQEGSSFFHAILEYQEIYDESRYTHRRQVALLQASWSSTRQCSLGK